MVKMDMQLYTELGKVLKKARETKKMSLDQLSEKIGGIKTKSTLKRYEDGESRIDMETLEKVCKVLSLNVAETLNFASARTDFADEIYSSASKGELDDRSISLLTDPEPELVIINRAMKNMDKEKKERMLQLLKISFKEEFDKNEN